MSSKKDCDIITLCDSQKSSSGYVTEECFLVCSSSSKREQSSSSKRKQSSSSSKGERSQSLKIYHSTGDRKEKNSFSKREQSSSSSSSKESSSSRKERCSSSSSCKSSCKNEGDDCCCQEEKEECVNFFRSECEGTVVFFTSMFPTSNLTPPSVRFKLKQKDKKVTLQWEAFRGQIGMNGVAYLTPNHMISDFLPSERLSFPTRIVFNGRARESALVITNETDQIRFYLNIEKDGSDVTISDSFEIDGSAATWIIS